MEAAERAKLEFALTDKLYYCIVKAFKNDRTDYGYLTVSSEQSGDRFVPLFTSREKALAYLYVIGYGRENSFVQCVEREDGVEFADEHAELDYRGFALDPPTDYYASLVWFEPDYLREWSEAVDDES